MAEKVQFDLVSPERVLASREVDMVTLPGAEGEFGVLPEHAPLVALLRPGVIQIHEGDKVTERVFVGGGFAEVSEEGCTVLAESAEPLEEIEAGEAQERLREAETARDQAKEPSDSERERLERFVVIAQTRVEIVAAR